MADILSRWLKQHAAGEKLLAKALKKYFADQGARVVATIEDLGLSLDAAHKAVDIAHEHTLLQTIVAGPIIGMMATGAENVLRQAKRPKSTKAFDSEALANFELPDWVKKEIEKSFVELEKQSYWQDIQNSTIDDVAGGVKAAIEQGMSMAKAAKFLRESFAFSPERAAAIARTETTGAYNLGHQSSYDFLHESGDIQGKEWLAVSDKSTRASHDAANGQVVAANEDFTVGGETAKFPGDPSLSAANRVNCRCTTAGVFE